MRDEQKQKQWFISFAAEKGFDPYKAVNWYACQRLDYSSFSVFR